MIIHPAATVLTIREQAEEGIQVLLLKRNSKLKFAPDFWVFPGGRIDPEDGALDSEALPKTAKNAAVREAWEEAGIRLASDQLSQYCHWTTPAGGTRRFSTWFFYSKIDAKGGDINIDNSEITDYRWIRPSDALIAPDQYPLLPPTLITLHRIKQAQSYADVRSEFQRTGILSVAPVTIDKDGLFYCLYDGDSGYKSADITLTQSLHRLIIDHKKGAYHFEYENCDSPPVNGGVDLHCD